ncbi:MAG: hypothetical protein KAS01_00905 [Candidatus Pacebacteria bacterium]|nr:hypothetical protein [Candidatus Paceibacterota bacterium]
MNKKNMFDVGKIYLMFVLLISALVIIIAIYVPGIVKVPLVIAPPEIKSDIVVEELEDGKKLVKNVKEGFSVVVPEGWQAQHGNSNEFKLSVSKAGSLQPDIPTELIDGLIFRIFDFQNKDKMDLEDWADNEKIMDYEKETIRNINFIKTESKMYEEAEDSFDLVPIENSIAVSYFFSKDEKIYEISCVSIGVNYMLYNKECENIVLYDFYLK